MNKIAEIIANKKRKTITEETIYETYKRVLCKECSNRHNNQDLCKIVVNIENKAQCNSYDRCMKNQCHGCKNESKCFEKEI